MELQNKSEKKVNRQNNGHQPDEGRTTESQIHEKTELTRKVEDQHWPQKSIVVFVVD